MVGRYWNVLPEKPGNSRRNNLFTKVYFLLRCPAKPHTGISRDMARKGKRARGTEPPPNLREGILPEKKFRDSVWRQSDHKSGARRRRSPTVPGGVMAPPKIELSPKKKFICVFSAYERPPFKITPTSVSPWRVLKYMKIYIRAHRLVGIFYDARKKSVFTHWKH